MNEENNENVSKVENEKQFKPIDQWQALNKITTTYKALAAAGFASSAFLGLMLLIIPFKDPTVVLANQSRHIFLTGEHKDLGLTKENVEDVVRNFVRLRYNWETMEPEKILGNLKAITSDGLQEKLRESLKSIRMHEIGDKKISQYITEEINVVVSEESVLAKFFVVINIEGKPIASPCELSFHVTQGPRTKWNPAGLYINGIISHAEAL